MVKKGFVNLKDIQVKLNNCLVEVDHNFLKEMIIYASNCNKPYKDKRFIEDLNLKFNKKIKYNTALYSLFRKNRAIRFSLLRRIKDKSNYYWDNIQKHIISIRLGRSRGKVYINFPLKLDKRLGSVIGHILGDGSIDSKYSQVFFTNTDIDLLTEFFKFMKQIFGIEGRIWLQESGKFIKRSKWIKRLNRLDEIEPDSQIGLFYPSVCGLIINIIFKDIATGKKKQITNPILNAPKEFKIGLIRAFFDDEGHLDKDRGPRFHQDNRLILDKIKLMLSELNIDSCPVRSYIRRDKRRHYFNVNSKINYLNYYNIIGCTSKRKNNDLKDLVLKSQVEEIKSR